jgi:hypothetical protein
MFIYLLLLGIFLNHVWADFSDLQAISTSTHSENGGTIDFTGLPGTVSMTGANRNVANEYVQYVITFNANVVFSVDWSYTTSDAGNWDPFQIFLDGNLVDGYTGSGQSASSTYNSAISSGSVLMFKVYTTDGRLGAPTVTLTNVVVVGLDPTLLPTSRPTSRPSSAPTYRAEPWGEVTFDRRRHRKGGLCDNHCSNHGTCETNSNCKCYLGLDGQPEWTGPDCSLRTCPKHKAWVGEIVEANDLHPVVECSNKGLCDRTTGTCKCFVGYDGVACQRAICPEQCNYRGTCWPERLLAVRAGRTYNTPWDSNMALGCICDSGYRGASCELQECPSGPDPLNGYGNEAGRDCSGRGLCDFETGTCKCFEGFFGTKCEYQTTMF